MKCKWLIILFTLIVLGGGIFYVVQNGLSFLDTLFGTPELDAAGGRVDADIESVSDSVGRSRESVERARAGIADSQESADRAGEGARAIEERSDSLNRRNQELEASFGRIGDAVDRGREAIAVGRDANRQLEELIRRLSEENGEGDPAQEDLADNLYNSRGRCGICDRKNILTWEGDYEKS